MWRRPTFPQQKCANGFSAAPASRVSCRRSWTRTSINTVSIDPFRQISCMAKTEHRRGTGRKRLSGEMSAAVKAALDKKALDVVVLDLRHTPAFTDFFLVCSGQNARQVQTIADSVEAALKNENVRPSHVEGYDRAEWILMDFFT